MHQLRRVAFLVALALGASLLLVGPLDRNSPEVNAALVRAADERKEIRPEDRQRVLSIPLRYDATVTQSGPTGVPPRTRFYTRKDTQ